MVVELINQGYGVVVLDNFTNSKPEVLNRLKQITDKNIDFEEVDLTEEKELEKVFENKEIDAVIHFAALKAVGESVAHPLLYYQNNLVSTLNLCKLMLKYNVNKLVFSSSCTVYGQPKSVPISEDSPLHAANPYGQTKLTCEQFLKDICAANKDFYVSCLRYFNPVGAHKSGLIGEDPNGVPSNLLPFAAQVAAGKRAALKIFGDDYETVDGTGVRDYIHITDLAAGHVAALKNIDKHNNWEAYNLGTGKGSSVLQVVKAFESASGNKIPYEIAGRRPGDVAEVYADPSKANRTLGWSAVKTMEEACVDTWNWQTKNPSGYGN